MSEFEPRSVRQTAERMHWINDAVSYLINMGIFTQEERSEAENMAETLLEASIDEGGEIYIEPAEAVDEELSYWGE